MDEQKRKGLKKLKESLLLAVEDMEQATMAAEALRNDTSDNAQWRRALETAMAVAYMRPFTKGGWRLPERFVPKAAPEKELHQRLAGLRHKAYAHSDEANGRSATMTARAESGDFVTFEYRSGWLAFPVEELAAVRDLCANQRERFLVEAAEIHLELEAFGQRSGSGG